MSRRGIVAVGAYVPRLRLQRAAMAAAVDWYNPALGGLARGERAMANWDEDAITMAVEAARDALAGRDRDTVGAVHFASTSLPCAERQKAGVGKEALARPDRLAALDATGSQRAGTSVLIAALDRPGEDDVLCIAAERRRAKPGSVAEFSNGDAAAAVVLGWGNPIAEVVGVHSETTDFVDHYRATDRPHDYEWEGRWIRDEGHLRLIPRAMGAALAGAGLGPEAVDELLIALPGPDGTVGRAVAAATGIGAAAVGRGLHDRLGYAGAAQPLLLLAEALERSEAGRTIMVVAFGQGVDVIIVRTTGVAANPVRLGVASWLERRAEEGSYLKHLAFAGEVELDGGMRAELDLKTPPSMLYRDRKTILALIGGKDRLTGQVQFPRSAVSVGGDARAVDTQDDYPLADRVARVITFTADRLAYSPAPPACYGMIEFDGGGRFIADFTDVDPDGVAVGDPVRMMFRLKRTDRTGFRHYFWKAVLDYRLTG